MTSHVGLLSGPWKEHSRFYSLLTTFFCSIQCIFSKSYHVAEACADLYCEEGGKGGRDPPTAL